MLGEVAAFGGNNVDPSVKSCFDKAGNKGHIEVGGHKESFALVPLVLLYFFFLPNMM